VDKNQERWVFIHGSYQLNKQGTWQRMERFFFQINSVQLLWNYFQKFILKKNLSYFFCLLYSPKAKIKSKWLNLMLKGCLIFTKQPQNDTIIHVTKISWKSVAARDLLFEKMFYVSQQYSLGWSNWCFFLATRKKNFYHVGTADSSQN
jgi:hypothetical protein